MLRVVVGGIVALVFRREPPRVGVFCLFALLPFLRAPSGAVGAFLAAFGAARRR